MPGKHLTNHEKGLIEEYRVMGKSKGDISRLVGRNKSCISRYSRAVHLGETLVKIYSLGRHLADL